MNSRVIVTLVLAVVLICAVLGFAGVLTFSGWFTAAKYAAPVAWSQPFASAQSMKIIDLTGDKKKDLFVQNATRLDVLDENGKVLTSKSFGSPLVTSLGDVNGDGVDDIVAFAPPATVTVLDGKGNTLWTTRVQNIATPARVAVVRFAGGTQVITGDDRGQLVALNAQGQEVWRQTISVGAVRGLDDIAVNGALTLIAASDNGYVKADDANGKAMWTYYYGGNLRRIRAYDLSGAGMGNVVVGGDSGELVVLDASTGKKISSHPLGQAITEVRDAEIDGNPSTREFVVGGKKGGVWAFRGASAEQLWSGSVSAKVTEIAQVAADKGGANDTIIGDDSGAVTLFDASGGQHDLAQQSTGITRIDAGKLTSADQIAVADGTGVRLMTVAKETAPIWYNPILISLFISLIIAVVAWFIATQPAKPVLRAQAEDQSVAGLQAEYKMLHENIADVERLKQSGEMMPDAYLARLKELRGQLAENEAALQQAGAPVKIETFKCPNCGGTLPLGVDKCEYCGQVVIS